MESRSKKRKEPAHGNRIRNQKFNSISWIQKVLDKAEYEYGIKIYDNDESISQECNSVANEINKSGLTPELILDFIIETIN